MTLAEDAAGALARHGRLLAVGFASGRWPVFDDPRPRGDEHDRWSACSRVATRAPSSTTSTRSSPALVRDGRLRNAVTDQVPFDELPQALQRMADRGVVGKLVMVP